MQATLTTRPVIRLPGLRWPVQLYPISNQLGSNLMAMLSVVWLYARHLGSPRTWLAAPSHAT